MERDIEETKNHLAEGLANKANLHSKRQVKDFWQPDKDAR